MNDKELLELAAKAAGVSGIYRGDTVHIAGIYQYPNDKFWNPLTDDGDALRLAVKLKLRIQWDGREAQVFEENYDSASPICACEVEHDSQTYDAATRRAIVRAAAEIGEAMP